MVPVILAVINIVMFQDVMIKVQTIIKLELVGKRIVWETLTKTGEKMI